MTTKFGLKSNIMRGGKFNNPFKENERNQSRIFRMPGVNKFLNHFHENGSFYNCQNGQRACTEYPNIKTIWCHFMKLLISSKSMLNKFSRICSEMINCDQNSPTLRFQLILKTHAPRKEIFNPLSRRYKV